MYLYGNLYHTAVILQLAESIFGLYLSTDDFGAGKDASVTEKKNILFSFRLELLQKSRYPLKLVSERFTPSRADIYPVLEPYLQMRICNLIVVLHLPLSKVQLQNAGFPLCPTVSAKLRQTGASAQWAGVDCIQHRFIGKKILQFLLYQCRLLGKSWFKGNITLAVAHFTGHIYRCMSYQIYIHFLKGIYKGN